MNAKWSSLSLTSSAAALGLLLTGAPVMAQSCSAAVEATKVEWRSLMHGSHHLTPTMRINTSDGRQLTGSQVNYPWVLIDRADSACAAADDTAALAYIQEFETLLHPVPRSL